MSSTTAGSRSAATAIRGRPTRSQIALREAREETGLSDLVPWPDEKLQHAVVCYVRPSGTEPEHEHGDLRYFLATSRPDAIAPENDAVPAPLAHHRQRPAPWSATTT